MDKQPEKTFHEHPHHILSNPISFKVLLALLILTIVTVAASRVDFGILNFPIAVAIACTKALLVMLFFMGLKYDSNENRVTMGASAVFVMIFFVLTATDMFTKGKTAVVGPEIKPVKTSGLQFKRFWEPSPEINAHGAKIFKANCSMCHGDKGLGDGVAGTALNPKPRNFTADAGWKNGRKPTQVFQTLTAGLGSMPSYSHFSAEDRWSLAHYVLSLGPTAPADAADDLKKAGIKDSTKDDGGLLGEVQKSLPIDFAMDRMLDGAR